VGHSPKLFDTVRKIVHGEEVCPSFSQILILKESSTQWQGFQRDIGIGDRSIYAWLWGKVRSQLVGVTIHIDTLARALGRRLGK
jgi:hypothetical protein